MYRVIHNVGDFQPGGMITAEQAGPNAARLVELGAIVPLGSEPPEFEQVYPPEAGFPATTPAATRLEELEARLEAFEQWQTIDPKEFAERLAAIEERLKELEPKGKGKPKPGDAPVTPPSAEGEGA